MDEIEVKVIQLKIAAHIKQSLKFGSPNMGENDFYKNQNIDTDANDEVNMAINIYGFGSETV